MINFKCLRILYAYICIICILFQTASRIIHPGKMLLGMISMAIVVAIFAYVSSEGRAIHNFKKQNPLAGLLIVICGGCFLTYTLGSLLVFLFGILLPFSGTFIFIITH